MEGWWRGGEASIRRVEWEKGKRDKQKGRSNGDRHFKSPGRTDVIRTGDRSRRKTRPNRIVTARRPAKVPPFAPLPADPRNPPPPRGSSGGGGTY
ncbi:hypothetical protein MTO96_015653 [Rhipicephalus appendiculatus]